MTIVLGYNCDFVIPEGMLYADWYKDGILFKPLEAMCNWGKEHLEEIGNDTKCKQTDGYSKLLF